MVQKWLPILARCGMFAGMAEPDILDLMPCFQPVIKSFAKDEVICRFGDPQDSLGVVLEGEIIVQKEDYSGNRLIIGNFGPAEIFGEVAAFAGVGVWPNAVVANTRCQVLFFPTEKYLKPCCKVCNAHQLLVENMLRIVARKAMVMNNRISYLKVKSMREKLAAFLYEQYQMTRNRTFMIPMNREQLADYLNVSRPSMSRELGRIRDEGVIDFYRSSFTIKDIEALRQMH